MSDGADPNGILTRLRALYPTLIDLSLDRLDRLLATLGRPERRLPPVIHVAGTNGKGSTCAFARAIAEGAGLRVHVMTSPHLVSLNERFRLAGRLVAPRVLADTLAEIERLNDGASITVFEALTAAGLLLFAREPADLAIIEVGLGGRFDATNVVTTTRATAITSISRDHEAFLGDRLEQIAGEKAGIMRSGVPCATGRQSREVVAVLDGHAAAVGTSVFARDRDWTVTMDDDRLAFEDAAGRLALPAPSLLGAHQRENAGIAIATLRLSGLGIGADAFAAISGAQWPARLQRLGGSLADRLPAGFELWLDGGHNPGAALVLAETLATWSDRPIHLVVGMKDTKDPASFLAPLLPFATSLTVVREADQEGGLAPATLVEAAGGRAVIGPDIDGALVRVAGLAPGRVLICGSLYLAGTVLARDGVDTTPA